MVLSSDPGPWVFPWMVFLLLGLVARRHDLDYIAGGMAFGGARITLTVVVRQRSIVCALIHQQALVINITPIPRSTNLHVYTHYGSSSRPETSPV